MTMQIVPSTRTTTGTVQQREQRRRAASSVRAPISQAAEHAPLEVLEDQRQLWLAHKEPISFERAVELVLQERALDGERADHLADLRLFGFGAVDGVMAIQQKAGLDLGGSPEPLRLRRRAFNALCSLVGIKDRALIAAMPAKLQAINMNWLMAFGQHDKDGAMLLRRAGGDLRSIHSDRYATFDDDQLLEIVDGVLLRAGYRQDAMVRASCVGPQLTLRLTIPNEGVELRQGDVIEWGLDIGNSEVGLRSIQVTPSTYRLICTNGLRSTEHGARTRIRHVGNHQEIREDLEAAIPAAFAEARGDIDRWRKSVDRMVMDALDDLEGLRGFGLDQGEVRAIGRTLIDAEPDMPNVQLAEALRHRRTTVYDLTNAITQTARDRSDVGARLELEETAHRYLARKTA